MSFFAFKVIPSISYTFLHRNFDVTCKGNNGGFKVNEIKIQTGI